MLNPTDLERALRDALPLEQHAQAPALALAILAAAQGNGHTALTDPALRPALRALAGEEVRSDGALISFGAGAQMGAVSIGDVAGRDVVRVALNLAVPPSTLTPQERRNRQAMIKKVRAIWVDGLLKNSLTDTVRIELGLTDRPDAVQLPLNAQYQELRREPRDLPAGTSITDVFDASGGSLLILGAPGAGKTTLLLELCRDLLDRAESDETQPIPVVFNLSSWGERRERLDGWMIAELKHKYEVPTSTAQQWISEDLLTPLLDGLDEVAVTDRGDCATIIDTYCAAHLSAIAVCSRLGDYEAM